MKLRKLLIILAVLMMTLLLAACGDVVEDKVEDKLEEKAEQVVGDDLTMSAQSLVGDWGDERSQRATMTIKANEDGSFAVEIIWSNSSSESDIWTMTANIEEDELKYYNGKHERVVFDSNGNETSRTVLEENTHGDFEFENGKLEWEGQMENEEALFARIG